MTPETTEDANTILSKYYWMQRQSTFRNAASTTVRFLESLLRYDINIVIRKCGFKPKNLKSLILKLLFKKCLILSIRHIIKIK